MTDSDQVRYVAGLLVGEGSFYLSTQLNQGTVYLRPRAAVKMLRRDREMLLQVRDALDLGWVKDSKTDGCSIWMLKCKEDLVALRDLLEDHGGPIWEASDKYENFQIWSDLVDIYADGQTYEADRVEMAEIALERGLNGTENERLKEMVDI